MYLYIEQIKINTIVIAIGFFSIPDSVLHNFIKIINVAKLNVAVIILAI